MPNLNKSKIIYSLIAFVFLITIIIIGAIKLPTQTKKSNLATPPQDKLFVATHDNKGTIYLNIFDVKTNTTTQKIVKIKDVINEFSKSNAAYANDAVQYNEKTNTVYISTSGVGSYDGRCLNTDGTCESRIYRLGMKDTTPVKIYSKKCAIRNWVITPNDAILVGCEENNLQTISLIDAISIQTIFTKEFAIPSEVNLTQFVRSNDGQFVYQFAKQYQSENSPRHIISLRKFSLATGELAARELVKSDLSLETSDTLSPDENLLAYYSGPVFTREPLHILDISTGKTSTHETTGNIDNINLVWSGDSEHVIQIFKDGVKSFNTKTKQLTTLIDGQQDNYIHTWGPSDHYITYTPYGPTMSETSTLQILDIKNQQTIDSHIEVNNQFFVVGARWF